MKKLPTPNSLDSKRKRRVQVKYPQSSTFTTRSKKMSLLVLAQHDLTKMARTAGRFCASTFSYSAKPNYAVWNYPCPRPLFKTCWLYRTVNFRSLSAAGLHFRIIWACLRWDDVQVKPSSLESKHTVTTDTEIITKEILQKRHTGRFDERTEYMIRKIIIPLEQQKTIREVTPFRSGLRKRKREETSDKVEPQISEIWVDESKLDLWEIRYFVEKTERDAIVGQTQSMLRPRPLSSAVGSRYELSSPSSSSAAAASGRNNNEADNKQDSLIRPQRSAVQNRRTYGESPIIKSILQTSSNSSGGGEKKIVINSGSMIPPQVLKLFGNRTQVMTNENGKVQLVKKIAIPATPNNAGGLNINKSALTSLLGSVISNSNQNAASSGTASNAADSTTPVSASRKIIMSRGT